MRQAHETVETTIYLECSLFKFLYYKYTVKSNRKNYYLNKYLSYLFYLLHLIFSVNVERSIYVEGEIERGQEAQKDSFGIPTEAASCDEVDLIVFSVNEIEPYLMSEEEIAANLFGYKHSDFLDFLEYELLEANSF